MEINSFKTGWQIMIDWFGNLLVDWRQCGALYTIDGEIVRNVYGWFSFSVDKCIFSPDSRYDFLYQRLDTKGILVKAAKCSPNEYVRYMYCRVNTRSKIPFP